MSDKKIVKKTGLARLGAVLSVGGLLFVILNHFIRWYQIHPTIMFVLIIAVILLMLMSIGWYSNGQWFGAIVDDRNRTSLSRLQIALWTTVVIAAYLTIAIVRSGPNALATPSRQDIAACKAAHIQEVAGTEDVSQWRAANPQKAREADREASDICSTQPLMIIFPEELLLAMGISTVSFAGSSLVKSIKRNKRTNVLLTDLQKKADAAKENMNKIKTEMTSLSQTLSKAVTQKTAIELAIKEIEASTSESDEEKKAKVDQRQPELQTANKSFEETRNNIVKVQDQFQTAQKTYEELKAKSDVASKENEGLLKVNESASQAKLVDLFQGDEIGNFNLIDLSKIQMFFFTVVIIMSYTVTLVTLLQEPSLLYNPLSVELPQFSSSLNTLLGISHAGYLGVKSVDQTKTDQA